MDMFETFKKAKSWNNENPNAFPKPLATQIIQVPWCLLGNMKKVISVDF